MTFGCKELLVIEKNESDIYRTRTTFITLPEYKIIDPYLRRLINSFIKENKKLKSNSGCDLPVFYTMDIKKEGKDVSVTFSSTRAYNIKFNMDESNDYVDNGLGVLLYKGNLIQVVDYYELDEDYPELIKKTNKDLRIPVYECRVRDKNIPYLDFSFYMSIYKRGDQGYSLMNSYSSVR